MHKFQFPEDWVFFFLIGHCFVISFYILLFLDLSILDTTYYLFVLRDVICGFCEERKVNTLVQSVMLNWRTENVVLEVFYICVCGLFIGQ